MDGPARQEQARMALGLFLAILTLFLLLAVVSYDPADPPLADYPAHAEPRNLGGAVGALLGGALRMSLGTASYAVLVLIGAAATALVTGKQIREFSVKALCGVLLVLSWACLADLIQGGSSQSPAGPGGILGRLLNRYVFQPCGWGAWLILFALFAGSVIFLTNFAPIILATKAVNAWRRRRFEKARLRSIVDAGPENHTNRPRDEYPAEAAPPSAASALTRPAGPSRRPAPDAPPIAVFPPLQDDAEEEQPEGLAEEGPENESPPESEKPSPSDKKRPKRRGLFRLRKKGKKEPEAAETPLAPDHAPEPQTAEPDAEQADEADFGAGETEDATENAAQAPFSNATPASSTDADASDEEAALFDAEERAGDDIASGDAENGDAMGDTEEEADEIGPEGEEDEEAGEDEGEFSAAHVAQPKPKLFGPEFAMPSPDLLDPAESRDYDQHDTRLQQIARMLESTLEEFGVDAQVVEVDRGPVITMYEIELAPGIKIGKIVGLADDIARALSATSVRIVAPIPGKSTVGIEVPNPERETVRLRDIFESGVLERKQLAIPMLLGKDASGQPLVSDLAQMPHCLIAGATGTGKSVCINCLIVSLLLTQHPDHLKLLLIDPKMVEFAAFKDIPHLIAPVVTDMKKATSILEWATVKMDERYEQLAAVGARNIVSFNSLGEEAIRERLGADPDAHLDDFPTSLPYIVIIIDELADLMMVANKEVENSIIRLAQKSRAVGIHLIVATQRPSVDVITGLIKSNLPSRIALQVASKVDSRTILDRNGAEKLLGQGDMLFLPPGSSKLIRAQGAYVDDAEVRRIVQSLKSQGKPVFDEELVLQRTMGDKMPWERDELFCEAVKIIAQSQRGSVSLLQRRLTVGYSRAARLIDMMAEMGLVGEYKGSQAREVLVTPEEWEETMQQYEQS